MNESSRKLAKVIPVAGGKGGVGKSLFTANLGRALAARGERCIAIDLDLGGSNLHTFLGFDNNNPGIGDFLGQKCASLSEFLVPFPETTLFFVPGDGLRPFLANMMHAHKMRLLRELTRLDADYILIDLGAGTSYNTLDFFRVWNLGLVVTTPEYPAIINMMNFVKNIVLRIIVKGIGDNTDELGRVNRERTDRIRQQLASLKLGLVVNQVKRIEDLQFVGNIQTALKRKLGVDIEWYGTLFEEPGARLGWHAPKSIDEIPRLTGLARIADRVRLSGSVPHETLIAEAAALQKYLNQSQ